jgi:hypothetical protein
MKTLLLFAYLILSLQLRAQNESDNLSKTQSVGDNNKQDPETILQDRIYLLNRIIDRDQYVDQINEINHLLVETDSNVQIRPNPLSNSVSQISFSVSLLTSEPSDRDLRLFDDIRRALGPQPLLQRFMGQGSRH